MHGDDFCGVKVQWWWLWRRRRTQDVEDPAQLWPEK
jgi:hypothetical protein